MIFKKSGSICRSILVDFHPKLCLVRFANPTFTVELYILDMARLWICAILYISCKCSRHQSNAPNVHGECRKLLWLYFFYTCPGNQQFLPTFSLKYVFLFIVECVRCSACINGYTNRYVRYLGF